MDPRDLEEMIMDLEAMMESLPKLMDAPEFALIEADGSTAYLGTTKQACLEYAMKNRIRGFEIEEIWV